MAKIFISYKYKDKYVRQKDSYSLTDWIVEIEGGNYSTARDYVDDLMQNVLTDHINKAEQDNEDLSSLSEETIEQKLYDRIYDSTVTIVLLSKKMKEEKDEKEQWIPRELAYSLKETTRSDRTSRTNGILAIALPDENDSYDHAVIHRDCGARSWRTGSFFHIIRANMFNRHPDKRNSKICDQCFTHHHYGDDHSYIHPVKWDDFIKDPNKYIELVLDLKDRVEEFDLVKTHD